MGAILGPAGLGGLKAAQTLVAGPTGVLIIAGGSIGLPEATKAFKEKGWSGLSRVARLVTLSGFLSFLVGGGRDRFFGRSLLSAIYGPTFGHLELAALLMAIAYVVLLLDPRADPGAQGDPEHPMAVPHQLVTPGGVARAA